MGKFNLVENLFVGVQELNAMQDFALNYYNIFGLLAKTFGLIENKDLLRLSETNNEDRESFKLSTPGALQLSFPAGKSFAFAYPNNLISWNQSKTIILPDSYKGKTYWVKIGYAESIIESGTLKMDSNGNIVGTGTFFTDKLRGEPGFPSEIELYTFNGTSFDEKGKYIVENVSSDTNINVYSETGTIGDTTLTYYYSIIGTFPIGSSVTEDEQNPFRYDSCELSFIEESTEGEIPDEYSMKESNTEFYVARIVIDNNGSITIQDERFVFEDSNNPQYSKWFSLK